jgi:polyhydroxyalkanoate synthesis regulator protein
MYDTEKSDYVTLKDLVGDIRNGVAVQILDHKTGKDLTNNTLKKALLHATISNEALTSLLTL